MKRTVVILSLIVSLVIALSVSIPALAGTDGSTVITGTVTGQVDLTSPPGNFVLGTMTIGATTNNSSGATGLVKCNRTWAVTAINSSGAHPGYMVNTTTSANLSTKLNIQLDASVGTDGLWANASTGSVATGTKTGDAGVALNLSAGQYVSWDDEAGSYTINISLTASMP